MQIYDLTLVVQTETISRKSVSFSVGKSKSPQSSLFMVPDRWWPMTDGQSYWSVVTFMNCEHTRLHLHRSEDTKHGSVIENNEVGRLTEDV